MFLWRCLLTLPADLGFLAVQRIRLVDGEGLLVGVLGLGDGS